ncbi:hypothetical protein FACS1894133_3920 [Clostridia bacterium]|nr:hypothetical protein FACS1894133_3920 [Clostridia bacterium]
MDNTQVNTRIEAIHAMIAEFRECVNLQQSINLNYGIKKAVYSLYPLLTEEQRGLITRRTAYGYAEAFNTRGDTMEAVQNYLTVLYSIVDPNNAEPSRAEPSRAEPSRAEPSTPQFGLNTLPRDKHIIVSFASMPARVEAAVYVADAMLRQTVRPDMVLLWLTQAEYDEAFADGRYKYEYEVLKQRGLTVRICEDNIRPHKKYYYTMREFPDSYVITVDDDAFYGTRLIETLLNSVSKYPDAISAMWLLDMLPDGNADTVTKIPPYATWHKYLVDIGKPPSHSYCILGVGGTVFPPGCLDPRVFNINSIRKRAITCDDIWLTAMAILRGTKRICAAPDFQFVNIPGSLTTALAFTNERGTNDEAVRLVFNKFDVCKALNEQARADG